MKLSIVTVSYNSEKTIEKTIQSVLSQKFKDYEYIIIDGKSTDGTMGIVSKYANNIAKIISEKDNGIYSAMNKGIRLASGEWVHLLNSDDYYYNCHCLEKVFAHNEIDAYDIIANAIELVDSEGGVKTWIPEYRKKENHYFFPHPGTIIRKNFYEKNGLYDEHFKVISDSVYINQKMPSAKYVIFKEPLVSMLNEGVSNQYNLKVVKEKIECVFKYHEMPFFWKVVSAIKLAFPIKAFARKMVYGHSFKKK